MDIKKELLDKGFVFVPKWQPSTNIDSLAEQLGCVIKISDYEDHEVIPNVQKIIPKQQSESLVFKGFVSASGFDKLDDIMRYLKGMLRRLEKLPIDPNQDRLKLIEVSKADELYNSVLSQQRKDKPVPQEILATKWMIEELRISLFSQNLGTAQPISLKRIINHLKEFT